VTDRPKFRTISLEDMRLFGEVAESLSFTGAAQRLGIAKQTLSRRVAELEAALDVQLLHRTSRRLHLTRVGAAYARRCAELGRLADDANRSVLDQEQAPRGKLRVTADPVFGEAFLGPVIVEYARRWPEVSVEVLLTRRRVALIEEGFDVAFRVGHVDDPALSATRLGPARIAYCASPAYVARRGKPKTPDQLAEHECIVVANEGNPTRWPFRGSKGPRLVPVTGRLCCNSFALAHAAARAGLGIALFPEFACTEDLRQKQLVLVLTDWQVDVGSVWLAHPAAQFLTARLRMFVNLALERLGRQPPWLAGAAADEKR
jgi:DNA-binding transcriptional LysR family regulator